MPLFGSIGTKKNKKKKNKKKNEKPKKNKQTKKKKKKKKKNASPIPSLWVSLTYISRISNEIVFLNLHLLYGINLNLIKCVTFLEKNSVFNATYSVCSISFHSTPFLKIPTAVYRANVKQIGKCTLLRVLKLG